MDASEFITIDVGGQNFKMQLKSLERYPNTLLGSMVKEERKTTLNELVFDRNTNFFPYIVEFYRMGELHLPSDMCAAIINKEMKYWKIERQDIAECCLKVLVDYDDAVEKRDDLRKSFDVIDLDYTDQECQNSKRKTILRNIWLFFDQPRSSTSAFTYSLIYLMFTILSVFIFCSGTHPSFRKQTLSFELLLDLKNTSFLYEDVDIKNPKDVLYATTVQYTGLYITEITCQIFFTFDFIFHFCVCPVKKRFFRYPMNCLDLFLVVLVWSSVVMELTGLVFMNKTALTVYIIFRLFYIFRIFRLLRAAKQSNGLNILLMTIRTSRVELLLLVASFLLAAVFFSSVIYYLEYEDPTTFPDMFSGIWWAIVTITTVGYGDMYPKTVGGKIVGSVCALVGIMIIAMPIAIIATNFNDLFEMNKVRENKKQSKRRIGNVKDNHLSGTLNGTC